MSLRPRAACRAAALLGALAGPAVALPACGGDARPAPLPPSAGLVRVGMEEYRFDLRPRVPRGRVVFRARNTGTRRHELVLLPIPEDFPPIAEQLRGKRRRIVGTLAFIQPLRPRGAGVLAVDLRPGRYAMVCLLQGRDGVRHAERGMATEFRVR